MFHRLARFLVLLAAVQILGGHWAVLQSVAWAGMIVDYAQRESLTVAVAKTFDGAHPCDLCHTVKEGRHQEKQQDAVANVVKIEAILAFAVQLPPRSAEGFDFAAWAAFSPEGFFTTPVPPPRRA